jgi:multiple sugar transport system permease protein
MSEICAAPEQIPLDCCADRTIADTTKPRRRLRISSEGLTPWLFLSPFLLLFSIFTLYPLLFAAVLSFHSWNPVAGLQGMTFTGLHNYRQALTDPWFWKAGYNTLVLALLSGVPQHLIAIPTAYLLAGRIRRWRHAYSAVLFVPYIMSTVAVTLIFFAIYAPRSGVLNQALLALADAPLLSGLLGFIKSASPLEWLANSGLLKPAVALVVIWKYTGFNIVIYTTAFLTTPEEIMDAARVDGCNAWQRFRHVALPMIRPFVFFAVTLTIIGSLQLFEEPFILTNGESGGVGQTVLTVPYYLYLVGWQWLEMGSAAALSCISFVGIAAATAAHFWIFGRQGLEKGEP